MLGVGCDEDVYCKCDMIILHLIQKLLRLFINMIKLIDMPNCRHMIDVCCCKYVVSDFADVRLLNIFSNE